MWCNHPDFKEVIKETWKGEVQGVYMYKVVSKLKILKKSLKLLNKKAFSSIEERFYEAKAVLKGKQKAMHSNPHDQVIRNEEKEAADHLKSVKEAYLSFLSQKAKIHWLKAGDANTNFFHRSIKVRQYQQRILGVQDKEGVW